MQIEKKQVYVVGGEVYDSEDEARQRAIEIEARETAEKFLQDRHEEGVLKPRSWSRERNLVVDYILWDTDMQPVEGRRRTIPTKNAGAS